MTSIGVKRVCVARKDGRGLHLAGIISHTDILRTLHAGVGSLNPSVATAPVGVLFPLTSPPLTLPHTATLRQCFEQLQAHKQDGCALVGDDGAIVGNVSVADVRGLADTILGGGEVEGVLDGLAVSFLGRAGDPRPPVTVTPADSLASVLELLCVAHVHRVHIVDARRRPVGVVTSMGLLHTLLSPHLTAHDFDARRGSASTGSSVYSACPFVGPALRSMTALEFAGVSGVLVRDLVEVAGTVSILCDLVTLGPCVRV
jgi:CBS domain-containing protein